MIFLDVHKSKESSPNRQVLHKVDEIHGTYKSSMMKCILMTYVVHYYRAGGIHGIIDGKTKILA